MKKKLKETCQHSQRFCFKRVEKRLESDVFCVFNLFGIRNISLHDGKGDMEKYFHRNIIFPSGNMFSLGGIILSISLTII